MSNKSAIFLVLVAFILNACQSAVTVTSTAVPTVEVKPTVPTPEPTNEPVKISYTAFYGGPAHGKWEKDNVAAFMAKYPGINVVDTDINIYATPVPRNINNQLISNTPPDVVSGPMAGVFLDYVDQGLIADITDLWEENNWYDKFPQSVIDMATVDGKQYFVPTMLQFHPIWYNVDVFAEHDITPPQTWDELLAICDKLSSAGQIPITISVSGWNAPTARWFSYIDLRVNGYEFHTNLMHGKISWQDKRVHKVFEYWQEMFDHNCFSEDVAQTNYQAAAQAIRNGDAAMYLLGEWLSESYPQGIPSNVDHFPMPVIDPTVAPSEIAHQYGAFMHAKTQHPKEAKLFLTWLGSVEVHNSFGKTLHRISTRSDLDKTLFDDKYWRGAEMIASTEHLTSLFELGTNADVATTGLSVFTAFIKDQSSIDDGLERMEAAREKAYGPLP